VKSQGEGRETGILSRILIVPIRIWQLTFSAILPPTCRFAPSCSAYAIEALQRHGPIKGGWLAVRRIGRCHPWGSSGYDPVP
jgi:putative membrane protein insertion efficiency factor